MVANRNLLVPKPPGAMLTKPPIRGVCVVKELDEEVVDWDSFHFNFYEYGRQR